MEEYVLLLCSLAFVLLLYGAARVSYSIFWKPKWLERQLKRQGIRGTPYRPLIGDMNEFVRLIKEAWSKPISLTHQIASRVDPFTSTIMQKYGKISMYWVGTTPRLIIMDTELMKEILLNKQGHFGKPPLNPLILILTRGLASLEGEKWTKHRRIINPAFHLERLKEMKSVFAVSCDEMIEQWKRVVPLGGGGGFEMDIWPEIQKLSAEVISRAAFGSTYKEGKKVFELQKELLVLTFEAMTTLYVPGFRRKKLAKDITSMLRKIIEKKMNAMRAGESRVYDLLGVLLQSNNQKDSSENPSNVKTNETLTIKEVIEECKQFYLAGQETTSSWITWTLIVLAMHPDWQEKARHEVLRVCGKKEPDFEAISHLKIVTMILNEVLRLYPPAIAGYQHTYKETKIGDIIVPAGVDITLPTLLIHHDPSQWGDDAGEFKPERFSGASKATKDHQQAFFPFGWGPRTCIGQNFAIMEAKVALAMLLQHFSFELSPSYTRAPYTVTILQPQHGALITLHQI
ncbi:hypothetical protein C1H46_030618 [Malus baccata]|uniref:Cytochrome P450 n=1 Tax=Malus baccata TaxID=106549 RepID=A0A540LBJ9_MALBA|nr:hypothetical protein C1H46_030618 [Malus baccata]